MIDNIITTVKLILAALPFVLLCFFSRKVNLPKTERDKQFPMPAVALAFCVIVVVFLSQITNGLLSVLQNLPQWISGVANWKNIPESIGDIFVTLGNWIRQLLNAMDLNLWIFYIANCVIILGYLLFKKIIITVFKRVINQNSSLHNSTAGLVYEYDEDNDVMCVKEEFFHTRGYLRTFYYTAVGLSLVLFVASSFIYGNGLIRAVFYPVFGVILLGELFFLLDGLTKTEYRTRVLGEDENAARIVDYTPIRYFLRTLFGDKVSAEDTAFNTDLFYSVTNEDVFADLRKEANEEEETFVDFYEMFSKEGGQIDHNYLYSSLDLLHGKSILFNNPFYHDLIPYAFYPMNRCLMNHGKVLVVLGRHAIEKDVEQWLHEGIESVTNIPYLWKTAILNDVAQETDIGILTRSDVLNIKVHDANEAFLNSVSFVVILEPSRLISTAQIGLNMLVKKCQAYRERNIVYCMCDKNCDGLVDAMSHILLTSITEVSATGKHKGVNSYMAWDVDDEHLQHRMLPSIARYLGVGTELSFAALKNQVSRTTWYGGEVFPVTDIRWIDRQYYFDLMKYAGLPANQDEMDKRFVTTPNYWSAKAQKYNYLTVEDEAYNMFEVIRDFSTRATDQGFVNVITPDYLLKEYMADNADIFETDPKAIPCIVPDFVRSRRNVTLKLILMLSIKPTLESLVVKEFTLQNLSVYDLREQLWHEIYLCFADRDSLSKIPESYAAAVSFTADKTLPLRTMENGCFGKEILLCKDRFNLHTGKIETVWFIKDKHFIADFVTDLKSASFVSEDEKGDLHYFGSELRGHVFQRFLPGQFFTFDGKYYCMDGVTANGDILIRRSADHINGRKFYRQLRTYTLADRRVDTETGAARDVAGVRIVHEHADIFVHTAGYLEMTNYSDFRTARTVRLDIEGVQPIERQLINKSFLRIELPQAKGLNDNVRYTIAVLMNEVFRSLFAENQAYIVALTDDSFLPENATRLLTYSVNPQAEQTAPCIYIVEDSRMDLGLLDAVERNLDRILDIIVDYICWHNEKMDEILDPPPAPEPIPAPVPETPEAPEKKECFLKRAWKKIKNLFKRKKNDQPEDAEPAGEEDAQEQEPTDSAEETPADDKQHPETEEPQAETEKEGLLKRMWKKIKNLFQRKKKETPENEAPTPEEDDAEDAPVDPAEETPEEEDLLPVDEASEEDTGADDLMPAEEETEAPSEADDLMPAEEETEAPSEADDLMPAEEETEAPSEADDVMPADEETEAPSEADDVMPADEETEAPSEVDDLMPADEETEAPFEADDLIPTEEETETPFEEDDLLPAEEEAEALFKADDFLLKDEPAETEAGEDLSTPTTTGDAIGEGFSTLDTPEMPAPEEDEADIQTVTDDDLMDDWSKKTERRPYNERYYTRFGFSGSPAQIDLDGVYDYLTAMRLGKNNMTQARDNRLLSAYLDDLAKKDNQNIRHCDFCGAEIYGIEFETLSDGRDRCMTCSRTAIKTGEEFKALFDRVKHDLELYFNVSIRKGVRVEMVNSRTLHKRLGDTFTPTPGADGRTLGVAIRKHKQFSLLVENGSPRMATMLTVAHELTHIWQYTNWDSKALLKKYGKEFRDQLYEGMAKWVEVQYAWMLNEAGAAKRMELETLIRQDAYGIGFLRYRSNYPFMKSVGRLADSPFLHPEEPLAPECCLPLDQMYILPPELPKQLTEIQEKRRNRRNWRGSDRDHRKRALKGAKNRTPGESFCYARGLLSENEQALFDVLAETAVSFQPGASDLEQFGVASDSIDRIMKALLADRPDLFWIGGYSYTYNQSAGTILTLTMNYNMTQEEAEKRQKEIDAALPDFVEGITDAMSDYEVVLKVYENIIARIDYDSIGLEQQEKERAASPDAAASQPDDLRSIYGVFVNRKAVCAGYAKATQYILNRYGIACLYYYNDVHAWNIVNLEGDYYHLDTTWGDATNTKPEKNGSEDVSYDCFCITDADLAKLKQHELNPAYPAPRCTATQCNYYRRFGAYFETYSFEQIRDLATSLAANGAGVIAFRCANRTVYDLVEQELIEEHRFRDILQFINLKTEARTDTSSYSYAKWEELLAFKFYLKKF